MPSDDRFSNNNELYKSQERPFTKYAPLKPQKFASTVSKKAPGTPSYAECLFQMINKGETETGGFKWARKLLGEFSDEVIWEMYQMWFDGNVHELLKKK